MTTKEEFCDLVGNAYQVLYDFVRLRNHPLTTLLFANSMLDPKERGWQMHHRLLETIEELDPGPTAPPFSKAWRRYRLMVLRYVEGTEPQIVADQLAISRRQFYREHTAAIETISELLWTQHNRASPPPQAVTTQIPSTDHAQAMQRELVRISQHDSYANVQEVIEGVLAILEKVLVRHQIDVMMHLDDDLPVASIGQNVLRQVVLGALGFLVEQGTQFQLHISAHADDSTMSVEMVAHGIAHFPAAESAQVQLDFLRDMLQLGHAHITMHHSEAPAIGYMLGLPIDYLWTVLAVDDNEDALALYRRCLVPNRYRVVTTNSAPAVTRMARDIQPDVIILDLMMPEHDGWDVLQQLSNQPATENIPIMICSVIKQKELALTLGAAAYLTKPFTEHTLLAALENLLNVSAS